MVNASATSIPAPSSAKAALSSLPSPAAPKENSQHKQLVQQTEKWVSQTFFGEMLKQMRNSPFRVATMDGGRGGEAYHQLFDQRLADHMTRGVGKKLVNSIVKKIESRVRSNRGLNDLQNKIIKPGSGHVSTDITA